VAHTIRQLVSREGEVCSQREPLQNADGMRFHPGRAVSCTSTYLRLRPTLVSGEFGAGLDWDLALFRNATHVFEALCTITYHRSRAGRQEIPWNTSGESVLQTTNSTLFL